MKIVTLEQFRLMPEGTIFCKYSPCVFGPITVFGGIAGEHDFISADCVGWPENCDNTNEMYDLLDRAEKTGESFEMDPEFFGRDGLFEKNQLFAVFERPDLEKLIKVLHKGIP